MSKDASVKVVVAVVSKSHAPALINAPAPAPNAITGMIALYLIPSNSVTFPPCNVGADITAACTYGSANSPA